MALSAKEKIALAAGAKVQQKDGTVLNPASSVLKATLTAPVSPSALTREQQIATDVGRKMGLLGANETATGGKLGAILDRVPAETLAYYNAEIAKQGLTPYKQKAATATTSPTQPVQATPLTANEFWTPETATTLGQLFGYLKEGETATEGLLRERIAKGDPKMAEEFNKIASGIQSGKTKSADLIDYFVNREVDTQTKAPDYGTLAKAPYKTFTPFAEKAPEFTPFSEQAPKYEEFSKKAPEFKPFQLSDYIADPGYQFRLDQGNKGINAAQAARGNFYSGAALKEANKFNSDMASQEFGAAYDRHNNNYGIARGAYDTDFNQYQVGQEAKANDYQNRYNRYNADYNTKNAAYTDKYNRYNNDFSIGYGQAKGDSDTLYNRLYGLVGVGSGTAGNLASANQANANAQGNIYGQVGNSQAANILNTGNSISGTLNDILKKSFGTSSYTPKKITTPWVGSPPWQQ